MLKQLLSEIGRNERAFFQILGLFQPQYTQQQKNKKLKNVRVDLHRSIKSTHQSDVV